MAEPIFIGIGTVGAILLLALGGLRTIKPHQVGILMRFGKFKRTQNAGLFWSFPIGLTVHRVDLRSQETAITLDSEPAPVQVVIAWQIVTPEHAFFEVASVPRALQQLARESLTDGDVKTAAKRRQAATRLTGKAEVFGVKVQTIRLADA